jgi:hypothetical protein
VVGHRPSAPPPTAAPSRGLACVAWANAAAAWAGAAGLASGALTLGDELDGRLPFASPVLAGVALAMVVALPLSGLGLMAWRGAREVDRASELVGLALIGWIAVQLAFLRSFSWFQPAYVVIGGLFITRGRWHRRPSPPTPAAAHHAPGTGHHAPGTGPR